MEDIFVPITMFTMIFGIVAVVMFFRFRNRQELQLTVRAIVDSGQPLTTEVLEGLTAALRTKSNDLRRGLILIALGLGFVVLANAVPDDDATGPLLGVSAFPFFTGFAYLLLAYFKRESTKSL